MPRTPLGGHMPPAAQSVNEAPPSHRTRRRGGIAALLVLLVTAAVGGWLWSSGTLAALVTINSGSALEFGQGNVGTTVCDSSIGTHLNQSWNQTSTVFQVDAIVVTSLSGCGGKVITLRLLQSDGTALALGTALQTSIAVTVPGSDGSATTSGATGATATLASGTLTVSLSPSTAINAANVGRITLETSS